MVRVVQLVRTPDCGSGGRGFKSHLSPQLEFFHNIRNIFNFTKSQASNPKNQDPRNKDNCQRQSVERKKVIGNWE